MSAWDWWVTTAGLKPDVVATMRLAMSRNGMAGADRLPAVPVVGDERALCGGQGGDADVGAVRVDHVGVELDTLE